MPTDPTITPRDAAAETTALVRDFIHQEQESAMPEQPSVDLNTIAKEAREAKTEAAAANIKADRALAAAERAEGAVAGLSHDVKRCTNEVADLKRLSTDHHDETMKAIAGAKETDTKQAADIAEARKSLADAQTQHATDMTAVKSAVDEGKKELAAVKGDISTAALVKISGALALVLTALATLFKALTPATPPPATNVPQVVYMAAPSAAPAAPVVPLAPH